MEQIEALKLCVNCKHAVLNSSVGVWQRWREPDPPTSAVIDLVTGTARLVTPYVDRLSCTKERTAGPAKAWFSGTCGRDARFFAAK